MKKFLIILGAIFGVILIALIVTPMIFKDDIQKAVDEAMAENLNARVFYDPDGFNLSLISNFPNFTLGMSNFGIAGNAPFENDTLVSIGSFEVVVDLMSVIGGDQIMVNAIVLDQPNIMVKVLPDGQANYDITVPGEEEQTVSQDEPTGESTAFNVGIQRWEIKDGNIGYFDEATQAYATIAGLNHKGSGDFTQDLFDINTLTTIDGLTSGFENVEYLSNKSMQIDMTLSMDLPNAKYTFKDNEFKLGGFGFGFDGYVSMPGDDIDMDMTFSGREISIASLLSLIPGAYQEYLDGLTTSGEINFDGFVKGTYNENSLPSVNAKLGIANGKIVYADYPIPVEEINMSSELNVPGENMDDMTFRLSQFSMLVDGEKTEASMFFGNLQNYTWEFAMNGKLDLEKMMKVMPLDSMELKGKIDANFSTSGNMALIEAEKYDQIPADGSLGIRDFYFSSADLPQGFGISKSEMTFNPKEIALRSFDATLGKSDMQVTGSLSNFIGFALSKDQILKGTLTFNSSTFDLNEWMTDEEVEEEEVEDTLALEVVRIPQNIDFRMDSKINQILFDNLTIQDLDGLITIKDGLASLDNVDFELLEGDFVMNGAYNSVPENPEYDFGFSITEMSIPASFDAFNTVQKMAPMAENMTGNFSTDFKINGVLGQDMMPIYDLMYGKGVVQVKNASLQDKLAKGISKILQTGEEGLQISDVEANCEIKDGRLFVEPFEAKLAGRKATIWGSNGIDGSLDYNVASTIKSGAAGQAVNSLLSSVTGGKKLVGETVDLTVNIGGTYEDPKVGLGSAKPSGNKSGGGSAIDVAKDSAKGKVKEESQKAAKEQADKIIAQGKKQADKVRAEGKKQADKLRADAKKQRDKLVKDAGSNFLKKKAAQVAGDKVVKEAEKHAKKLEAESNKRADQIEAKAQKQADAIMAKAN